MAIDIAKSFCIFLALILEMSAPPKYLILFGGMVFRNQNQNAKGSYYYGNVIVSRLMHQKKGNPK